MTMWYLDAFKNETYAYYNNAFTPEECEFIINIGSSLGLHKGSIMRAENSYGLELTTRNSDISWIGSNEDTAWIFRRITDLVTTVNSQFFNFDLLGFEELQFTKYHSDYKGFYSRHTDYGYENLVNRKLSFSVQLSDPDTYEGGDLVLHGGSGEMKVQKDHGTMIFFPSFTLHEVKPVTKGLRYSLVGWVNGPRFR